MEKFDSEEQGALTLNDFRRLQQEVTIQKAFDPQLEMQLLKASRGVVDRMSAQWRAGGVGRR